MDSRKVLKSIKKLKLARLAQLHLLNEILMFNLKNFLYVFDKVSKKRFQCLKVE